MPKFLYDSTLCFLKKYHGIITQNNHSIMVATGKYCGKW